MTRMHADELDIDEALVRRLVGTQFPEWADLPLEPVFPVGTDNALYRLGEDMVVRLPRRPTTRGTLEKERRWLPRLAPLLPVAVPVPLADGGPGDGFPFAWFVYRWLPGETAVEQPLANAAELAEFIAVLHEIDPTGGPAPGPHNFFRGVPLVERDDPMRAAIESLRGRIDADAATAVWESALAAPDWTRAPVWIHGDLDARNVLVQEGRLSGVIDWGGLAVGDPATDVMVAWKAVPADGRDDFRAALDVDEATWARARGWVLSQALIALAYYTLETNPTLVREAQCWLAEALSR